MEKEQDSNPNLPITPEEWAEEIKEIMPKRLEGIESFKNAFLQGIEYSTVSLLLHLLKHDEKYLDAILNTSAGNDPEERCSVLAKLGDKIYQLTRDFHLGAHLVKDGEASCSGIEYIRHRRASLAPKAPIPMGDIEAIKKMLSEVLQDFRAPEPPTDPSKIN